MGIMWVESNVRLFIHNTTNNELSRAGLKSYWQHKRSEDYRKEDDKNGI